jgi:hypothetical protein
MTFAAKKTFAARMTFVRRARDSRLGMTIGSPAVQGSTGSMALMGAKSVIMPLV